jgi:hypothetical protein
VSSHLQHHLHLRFEMISCVHQKLIFKLREREVWEGREGRRWLV